MEYSTIKGFNYQPSYGSTGFELWQRFDADTIEQELERGRRHFPKANALRIWLCWHSFVRNPLRFAQNFDTMLAIADSYGFTVMPVLFNRWHDKDLDYGGIYLDHLLPGLSWVHTDGMFSEYISHIVGQHAEDPRIFCWDLCNEPFSYWKPLEEVPAIATAEYRWLEDLYLACKDLGVAAPLTVGIHAMHRTLGMKQIEPLSDVLSIHPYWIPEDEGHGRESAYEHLLDDYMAFAASVGKPLLATETCWGALNDSARVRIIRYTLGELRKRHIGWLAYLLHHSLVPDAHRPEFGPVGSPGNLSFIEADGTLRRGHEVFNEF